MKHVSASEVEAKSSRRKIERLDSVCSSRKGQDRAAANRHISGAYLVALFQGNELPKQADRSCLEGEVVKVDHHLLEDVALEVLVIPGSDAIRRVKERTGEQAERAETDAGVARVGGERGHPLRETSKSARAQGKAETPLDIRA